MKASHRRRQRGRTLAILLVGASLPLLLIWLVQQLLDEEEGDPKRPPPVAATECDVRKERQEALLAARRVVIEDWEAHVEVEGQQAPAVHAQTKQRGEERLTAYVEASRAYGRAAAGCGEAPTCHEEVKEALASAERAADDWRTHLMDMQEVRAGRMTGWEAWVKWEDMRREAPRNIDDYREKASTAERVCA